MKYLVYINIITLLFTVEAKLYGHYVINWYVAEEPPISYTRNDSIVGYGIDIIKRIQAKLPEYKHDIVMAGNYARLTNEVMYRPLSIGVGLFKTEKRKRFMSFTNLPLFYFYNIQVATKKSTFNALGKPDHISLKKILNDKRRIGISKGRTYSKNIRNIFKENKNSNIYKGSQGNVSESLLSMLVQDRLEYILLYPEETEYISKKVDLREDIITIPIEETEDISFSWLAVHKDKAGKLLVRKINSILEEIQDESYPNYYLKWISKNNHKSYREKFRKFRTDFDDRFLEKEQKTDEEDPLN
ncbi:MAG: hypothetical protein CR982_06635 [Candidatus Cloacimonadota bacterium]|nr:MAG: hypothetical protein CR982_06635 [Candidatus Cloacimonadota bacterium]PIE77841.1 MAG: hypothetical protein CSA15_11130 [Candidatus Delongbacteria bacterium]